jgi:hypothetical protein
VCVCGETEVIGESKWSSDRAGAGRGIPWGNPELLAMGE